MQNIRETCLQFFQNEDIKRDVQEMIRPIVGIMYNELYPYLLLLCIYNIFLFFIVLANLVILLRLLRPSRQTNSISQDL
jgi:hypothetical protein